MANVKTNFTTLQAAIETSPGVLPGSPTWKQYQPNDISDFAATIATVARRPISPNRMAQKGTVTDLDSSPAFNTDLTYEATRDFLEGFAFAVYTGPAVFGPFETNDVTAATVSGYTVSAGGALVQNTLVYARGFSTSANNGLKVVGAGSTGTNIDVSGLTAEPSPPTNAEVAVAGFQGASGDIGLDANGDLTSIVLDFTTLSLSVGQFIWVGGETAGTQFATAAYRGYARILTIAAHLITLDKRDWTVAAADNGSGKTIQVFFGRFLRNVAVTDGDFLERSFNIEAGWQDLIAVGTDGYEYAIGSYCNTVAFNIPLTDKVTLDCGFVAMDVEAPTSTRKTNASTPILAVDSTAYSSTSNVARLSVAKLDETGLTTWFKSLTFTLNNNVSPEKVVGLLGGAFMNVGNLDVTISGQILFTNGDVVAAIRNNTTVTMDFALRNENGAMVVDVPEMTLGDGSRDLVVDATVLQNLTGTAHQSATFGTAFSVSVLPYAPAA